MKNILIILFLFTNLNGQGIPNGDILNETPLYPIPVEMTFEEYQDMNRRLTIGLALSSIPIPGIVHRYAGERKKASRVMMIGASGFGLMIAGASMMSEGDWPESDYDLMILNDGENNEKRYEKIPINQVGDDIAYKLVPLNKENDGSGGGLIVVGAIILVGDIFYDWIYGWKMIVQKRDAVRYKYGQQIQVSIEPEINPFAQKVGLGFSIYF